VSAAHNCIQSSVLKVDCFSAAIFPRYQTHLVQVKDKRKTNLNLTSTYTQRWSYLSRILSMHVQKRKHWSSNLVDRLVYTLISEIPFLISVRPSKLLQRNQRKSFSSIQTDDKANFEQTQKEANWNDSRACSPEN
jgi:hypothetical protein